MPPDPHPQWRSLCPLNIALEVIGDRWALLILRDLLLKRFSTFREFQESGEGIATNILTDRLKRLSSYGIIKGERSQDDARIVSYRPTKKGLDLLPTIIELIIWADRYETTIAPRKLMHRLSTEKESFINEVLSRFKNDPID